jgi:nitrogenase molybdenum-iron protein NifN
VLAGAPLTAATHLKEHFGVPAHRLGFPMGVRRTDQFMETLAAISGRPVPQKHQEARGRLLDALVDGHKYVNGVRAVVYGEGDLVAGLVDFLSEIGIVPVICATGDGSGRLGKVIRQGLDKKLQDRIDVIEGVDFVDIEARARQTGADLMIGNSKGYSLARKLGIPLIRVGFPIHDRLGGNRVLHLGYAGTQALFDRIADALFEQRQASSDVGYTYM